MTLTASDLRSRVGFHKKTTAPPSNPDYGESGEGEFSDTPEFVCAANIRPRLGGEAILAARLTGVEHATITVRQSSDTRLVTTDWKVVDQHTDLAYNIRSIIDPDQNTPRQGAMFELLCQAGVAI